MPASRTYLTGRAASEDSHRPALRSASVVLLHPVVPAGGLSFSSIAHSRRRQCPKVAVSGPNAAHGPAVLTAGRGRPRSPGFHRRTCPAPVSATSSVTLGAWTHRQRPRPNLRQRARWQTVRAADGGT